MEEKKYVSIEEIDKDLEEEFKEEETEDDDEMDDDFDDDEDLDDASDEDDESDEESDEDDEEDDEPEQPAKPTREQKKEHAFKELREAKANAERLAAMERAEKLEAQKAAEREKEFMKKLAKTSGYDDVEEYRKDLEKRLIEEEAKQHGVTPAVYKQLAEAKAKVDALEQEKKASERAERSQKFLATIDKVLKGYEVDREKMSKELFATLEKSGYTIDALLAIPQPELLIRGALYDKLSKAKTRDTDISEGLETKKLRNSAAKVKSIDDLIEEEMVAYAKARNLKYVK